MRELLKEVWSLFDRRQKRWCAVLFGMMLVGAGFEALGVGLVMPFIALVSDPGQAQTMPVVADIFGALGVEGEGSVVIAAGLGLLGIYIVKNAFLALMYYSQFRFVFNNQVILARRLLKAYLRSPYEFHLNRNSAQLLRNINEEVRLVFLQVLVPLLTLGVELSVVVVLGLLLLAVEPLVAPVAILSFGLLSLGFYRAVRRKTVTLGKAQQHHMGLMIQWVNQGLGGIKEAKVAGCEEYFLGEFTTSSQEYAKAMRFHRFVKEVPRNVVETAGLGGMILVVVLLVARGQDMTHILPVLGLFAMAAIRLLPSLTRIIAALTGIRHFRPSVEVIAADLRELRDREMEQEREDDLLRGEPIELTDRLELRDVGYTYPESDVPTLRGVNLVVERGQTVALVGSSGAGKTTCVDLILGLLRPDEGEILVDGRPIGGDLGSWQRRLGYIAQPTYLMDDSVRRNVAFGVADKDVEDAQVWACLRDAQLADLVSALPEGLDTRIGEGGVRISGGQRQRLGIARALYRRPELLVLDEATSALDNATEREVTRALKALSGRVTLIIIAHRLSTVRHADGLFLLEDGQVTDSGTYEELLRRNRAFQQLVQAAADPEPDGPMGRWK